MSSRPHVAIAGGGPAGACAAMVLAASGIRASVYEAAAGPQDKVGDSLPPAASAILRRLDLLRGMAGHHTVFYGNRSWWGSNHPRERSFLFDPNGSGWRLNRREFESMLASEAQRRGVEWHFNTRVLAPERDGGVWILRLRSQGREQRSEADFFIDATGRRSALCRSLGARRSTGDRLVGIAALLGRTGAAVDSFTSLEAVESGWWYSAVQPDGQLAVICFTDHDLPGFRETRTIAGWSERLRAAPRTWERASLFGPANAPLRVLPAGSAHVEPQTGAHWLVAGDAAAAHDPLSSYGIAGAMGSGFYAGCAAGSALAGEPSAADAYREVMQQSWAAYLHMQREAYAGERRWPESAFWARRLPSRS